MAKAIAETMFCSDILFSSFLSSDGHPIRKNPLLPSGHQSLRAGRSVWRVIWPGDCRAQFGRTSTCPEPHTEQRNLPFTSGNGDQFAGIGRQIGKGRRRDHGLPV
jgi:hypothetical protein